MLTFCSSLPPPITSIIHPYALFRTLYSEFAPESGVFSPPPSSWLPFEGNTSLHTLFQPPGPAFRNVYWRIRHSTIVPLSPELAFSGDPSSLPVLMNSSMPRRNPLSGHPYPCPCPSLEFQRPNPGQPSSGPPMLGRVNRPLADEIYPASFFLFFSTAGDSFGRRYGDVYGMDNLIGRALS